MSDVYRSGDADDQANPGADPARLLKSRLTNLGDFQVRRMLPARI